MVKFKDSHSGVVIETERASRIRAYRRHPDRWIEEGADAATVDVPEGTVAEVLAWAGDDPERRTAAWIAEQVGKQRKGVLDALK